jgi:hypothetical protein
METTVIIKDLPEPSDLERKETALSPERMKSIFGGRKVLANVGGTHLGTIDDWDVDVAIFEGRIGGSMI